MIIDKKKIVYYAQEAIVFVALTASVIFSGDILKRLKGKVGLHSGLLLNWESLIIALIIASVVYGSLYTRPYEEDKKLPPFGKRLSNAIIHGVAWQSVMDIN